MGKHRCNKKHPCRECQELEALARAPVKPQKEKLPNMSAYKDLLENIKTPICGLRKVCELHNPDCNTVCVKEMEVVSSGNAR